MSSQASGITLNPLAHKEVRVDVPSADANDSESTAVESEKSEKNRRTINPQTWKWPVYLSWVPGQLNWQGLKPVLRSAIASWIVFLDFEGFDYSHLFFCFV